MSQDTRNLPAKTVPTSSWEAPRGTTAMLAIYGGLIVVLWGFMYVIMLLRG